MSYLPLITSPLEEYKDKTKEMPPIIPMEKHMQPWLVSKRQLEI
jgi:hypothetical protein